MFRKIIPVVVGALLASGSFSSVQAADIKGAVKGSTVTAPPEKAHPMSRDDKDTTTTVDIKFLTTSDIVNEAAKAFPTYKFVYAGVGDIGSKFTPISASDFTIDKYAPWVVNSPDVKSPGGHVYNRGVVDQDAGGASIIISYLPTKDDPFDVNFLQAYTIAINKGAAGKGTMDNCGATGPYYNQDCAAGADSNDVATVPLKSNLTTKAWILDTPYICESGFSPGGTGCPATTPATDETITNYVDMFDTFLEADQTYKGTLYSVLYGGFHWGFTFTAVDVPEPDVWALMLVGFFGLGARLRAVRRRSIALGA